MESRYSQPGVILLGMCDHTARLGYANAFTLCQDLATVHAEQLGVGAHSMTSRGLFWLTVKTKLRFLERPAIMDTVTLRTHPLVPERLRTVREYVIEKEGRPLILGKTEWAVLDTTTGRLHKLDDVFPDTVVPVSTPEFDEPFARVADNFDDSSLLGTHRVCSTDIDLGRHMNNVAYLRALLSFFSTHELDAMHISQIELAFRNSCYEGDELRYYARKVPDGLEFAAFTDAPKPALLGKLTF